MASGTLGQTALAAGTNTSVYTVPTGKVGTFSVNFCNRGIQSVWVRLAISTSTSPTTAEWLLYDVLVNQYGTLERTGLMASAGKQVICYADNGNVSVNIYGYED